MVTSRPADAEHPRRRDLEARWQNCVLPRSWRPRGANPESLLPAGRPATLRCDRGGDPVFQLRHYRSHIR